MVATKFPPYQTKYMDFSFSVKQAMAEFVSMTIFVFVVCGTALSFSHIATGTFDGPLNNAQNWGITTGLVAGFTIMYLVYTFGHISGGQVNCAVTMALVLSGHLGIVQGAANFVAQLAGSLLGAGMLYAVVPNPASSSLGATTIAPGYSVGNAIMGEIMMTFVLCFVVQMTACWPKSIAKNLAPFAIGMVVFTAHGVLISVTGASINPTRYVLTSMVKRIVSQDVGFTRRSFGPAILSGNYADFWVYWVGPLSGAIISVPFYLMFRTPVDTVAVETTKEDDKANDDRTTEVSPV